MTRDEAQAFAAEWAVAWNELAVERVLAHFDENASFTSPTALAVMDVGTIHGKQSMREYWNKAIGRVGALKFVVDRVLWDADSQELAIVYVSETGGRKRRVSENLTFGQHGLVVSAEVFHGVDG